MTDAIYVTMTSSESGHQTAERRGSRNNYGGKESGNDVRAKPKEVVSSSGEPEEEKKRTAGKSTLTRCILTTSSFIWLPAPCQPTGRRVTSSPAADDDDDRRMTSSAVVCARWQTRRNAVCDHMAVLLPQATREMIEKQVAERKTSLTRRVLQRFRSFYTSNYEVDLF